MAEYVLGMDPITFTMTLFSVLGFVLSIFTFAYYYNPSRQVQDLSERIDQTWQLFQSICEADSLPCSIRMRLYQYFEKYGTSVRCCDCWELICAFEVGDRACILDVPFATIW